MTKANTEDTLLMFDWILCIYHFVWFKNDKVRALINFSSKINIMSLQYA